MKGDHYSSPKPSSLDRRGLILTTLRGREYGFITSSGVFSGKRVDTGTRVLVEAMVLPGEGRVLDMGCGIGVIGIVASCVSPGLEVHLTDINGRAVELTRLNVVRNGCRDCTVHMGDLYEPLKGMTFNTIISNPPISAGMRKVVFPLVEGAYTHLEGGGNLQLVIQSNKGGRMLARFLDEVFGEHRVLSIKSGYRVFLAEKPR